MDFKCTLTCRRSSAKSKSFAIDTKNELLLEVIDQDASYLVRVRSTEARILVSSDRVKTQEFLLTVTDPSFSPADLWWLERNEAFLHCSAGNSNSIEVLVELVSLDLLFD